jgi:hypothetical protein
VGGYSLELPDVVLIESSVLSLDVVDNFVVCKDLLVLVIVHGAFELD